MTLEQLAQVGGVRAFRIRRDLGVSSIPEVAELSIEELQEVWSVGPMRSRQIKGSAQGWVEKNSTSVEEERVLLVGDDDSLEEPTAKKSGDMIQAALQLADVTLDEDTTVGWVDGELGGGRIQAWYGMMAARTQATRTVFKTPWTKYAYFLWDKWGYEEQPDIENPIADIPFEVNRVPEDVEAWMAPTERTQNMVQWADQVVIVADGEYTDKVREECRERDVDCFTAFDVNLTNDGATITSWEPEEDPEPTQEGPDLEEAGMVGDGGAREGSPEDLEPEDEWVSAAAPNHTGESRDDSGETGGKGVGSNMDKWS